MFHCQKLKMPPPPGPHPDNVNGLDVEGAAVHHKPLPSILQLKVIICPCGPQASCHVIST
jgi:hypothetical protein